MNRADFKPCAICHKGMMHTGLPLFYRVTIERMGIDLRAVRQQHGLEQLTGSVGLADVFSPNSALASPLPDPSVVLICEECAMKETMIAVLAESGS